MRLNGFQGVLSGVCSRRMSGLMTLYPPVPPQENWNEIAEPAANLMLRSERGGKTVVMAGDSQLLGGLPDLRESSIL